MPETVLRDPTVGDVIRHLLKLNPDMPFHIQDADTGWDIHVIHVAFFAT